MTETTKRTTKVWAHRGASGYRPENTLEAFELAIRQGADGIELDVHTSADGELIVMHDENCRPCHRRNRTNQRYDIWLN